MSTEDKSREDTDKSVEPNARILDLCDIILVYQDYLEEEKARDYIDKIIECKVEFSGDRYYVRSIVQPRIMHYIEYAKSPQMIFAFATDFAFYRFRKEFTEYYTARKAEKSEFALEGVSIPVQLEYLFDYIQEAIDFRALHERLSFKMLSEIKAEATEEAIAAVEEVREVSKKDVEVSFENGQKKIEDQITQNIKEKMTDVNKNISETSVTILGMFSGIVLTVVAGLFYSSSVLESVSQAEIYRLLAVAAVVGIVCFDLVALMFMYINRIRGKDRETPKGLYRFVAVVNILLIALMIFSLYKAPEIIEQEKSEPKPTPNQEIEIHNEVELGRY